MAEMKEEVRMLCGICPDSHCGKLLYFVNTFTTEVECESCGQKHPPGSLLNVKETTDPKAAMGNILKSILLSNPATKKGTELVKVRGLSNFHCKLISPLLTKYGMDKKSGKAKLLSELGQPEVFNCSVFGNRAFLIEKEHVDTPGYGRDITGSSSYLKDTLALMEGANSENCLVPLHSDGDGHCLVHAISRAVVGRELLWHSLRQNLKDHLKKENMKYQDLFQDFIDINEWDEIIAEADPDYHPATNEPFGLRNMHVFGLANILHRPIILLDSLEGMQSSGDYSGTFLPVLANIEQCKTQEVLNKPLVIAWSSSARNHYVPLVGIKDLPPPKIPKSLLPKAWGIPNEQISTYIEFDESGYCAIGGSRSLPESYVQRLVSAMDEVFFEKYQVLPELVADVNQFVFKPSNAVGYSLDEIIEFTQNTVESERLFRCLLCHAVKEVKDIPPRSWREPGGRWYTTAQETDTGLIPDAVYVFNDAKRVPYMYEAKYNMLMPVTNQDIDCDLCKGVTREVSADGSVRYMNGDRTTTKSTNDNGCKCGFKHFWNGNEYDNLPKTIDVSLEWNSKKIDEQVFWFYGESDASLNSNVYELATGVVQKHFPGEFGSEVLVRKVVDKILLETVETDVVIEKDLKLRFDRGLLEDPAGHDYNTMITFGDDNDAMPVIPSKVILTGPKKKTLHKEELTRSEQEKLTRARITHGAAFSQKRKSSKDSPEKINATSKHGKQEIKKTSANNAKPKTDEKTTPNTQPHSSSSATSVTMKPSVIRLVSSDGHTATTTLKPSSTFTDLQEAILAKLGIPNDRQKIRYGFPPRELKPPEDENAVLPLSPGDRVSVEVLPDPKAQEEEKLSKEPGEELMDVEVEGTSNVVESSSSSDETFEGVDRKKLASDLLNYLQEALNIDKWETVQNKPELFARGGVMYEQVVAKLGPLKDDMHCSIVGLPGKTFAYNAKEDRFEICLGQKHIPVQPLDEETLSRAHSRSGDMNPMKRPESHEEREGLGAFSGAVRHKDASEGRATFSGTGRTLGGSVVTKEEEKKDEGLSAMNLDVPHSQVTTHDQSISGTTVDEAGKDREGNPVTTPGGDNLPDQSVSSDTEMVTVENEEGKNAHVFGLTEHEASSIEHGDTEMEPEISNGSTEGQEIINSEHFVISDEHADEQSKNETLEVSHANTQHETLKITHETNSDGKSAVAIDTDHESQPSDNDRS